jgi:biopolymer transport protein ExbD
MRVASPIPHKKARIEIIPLIDIMFFLLASFMMVSLSQVHMKGMKVNLPKGASGETQSKKDYISVSVDEGGHWYFDKQELNDVDMQAKLKQVHMENPEAKVFVRGDANTPHINVTRLLDQLRNAGFYKIAFEIKSYSAAELPATKVR